LKITKRFRFSAAHRLFDPALSDSENKTLYGACFRHHGHNFVMEVTLEGGVDGQTGMVVNFTLLKKLVKTQILDHFDHRDFGTDIPEFEGRRQTVEVLAQIIWNRLVNQVPEGTRLDQIRISETENSWIEFSGK